MLRSGSPFGPWRRPAAPGITRHPHTCYQHARGHRAPPDRTWQLATATRDFQNGALEFGADALPRNRGGRVHRLAAPPRPPRPRPRGGRLGRLHRLLRPRAQGGERSRPARLPGRPRDRPARPRRARRGLPSRRSARGGELRGRLSALRAREPARKPAAVRSRRARTRSYGARVVLVDLRGRGNVPDGGGHGSAPDLAVRCDEARLRAPRARVRLRVRARRGHRQVLHHLRAAPAPRHGVHEDGLLPRGGPAVRALWRRIAVSMLEAIETLGDVSGRRLEVVCKARRDGDVARTAADITRIRAALGWEPTTPFRDGLAAQWRWAADRVAAR